MLAVAACSGGGGGTPDTGTGGGSGGGGLEGGDPGGDDRSGYTDYSSATGVVTSTGEVWQVEIVHHPPGGDPALTDGVNVTELGAGQ